MMEIKNSGSSPTTESNAVQLPIQPLPVIVAWHILTVVTLSIALFFVPVLPFTTCMHPYYGKLGWSLIGVFGFLVMGELLGELSLFGKKFNLNKLRAYLGSQFILKTPWLLVTVIVVYASSFVLVRYLGSLQVKEPPIVLKQFSVILSPGSEVQPTLPDSSINIPRGYLTLFLAEVDPSTTGCQWSSLKSGTLQTADQCSTYYNPPLRSDFDLLDLKLTSVCSTKQNVSHLKVLVLP